MEAQNHCIGCGKIAADDHTFYQVQTYLPNGEQQQLWVCENCLPLFEKAERLFKVLGGPTYTEEQQPPLWQNHVSLDYQHFHITHGELPYITANFPAGTTEAYPLDRKHYPLLPFL